MDDALSVMLTAYSPFILSRACFNGTYPGSLLLLFCPISLKATGDSLVKNSPSSHTVSRYTARAAHSPFICHNHSGFLTVTISFNHQIRNRWESQPLRAPRKGRAIQKVLPLGRNIAWVTCYTFLSRCGRCHILGFIFDSDVDKLVARETCISGIIIVHPFLPPFDRRGASRKGDSKLSYNNSSRDLYTPAHWAETDDLFNFVPMDLRFELNFLHFFVRTFVPSSFIISPHFNPLPPSLSLPLYICMHCTSMYLYICTYG